MRRKRYPPANAHVLDYNKYGWIERRRGHYACENYDVGNWHVLAWRDELDRQTEAWIASQPPIECE